MVLETDTEDAMRPERRPHISSYHCSCVRVCSSVIHLQTVLTVWKSSDVEDANGAAVSAAPLGALSVGVFVSSKRIYLSTTLSIITKYTHSQRLTKTSKPHRSSHLKTTHHHHPPLSHAYRRHRQHCGLNPHQERTLPTSPVAVCVRHLLCIAQTHFTHILGLTESAVVEPLLLLFGEEAMADGISE